MLPIPAGTAIRIDVAGLHYNRKSHSVLSPYLRGSQTATQHDIGTIHMLSDQRGSWGNGIRTLFSRSPPAQGHASDAGNPFPIQSEAEVFTVPKRRFFEKTGLAMLTMFIQRYRVEPHPKFAGESFERLKERYSEGASRMVLT